MKRQLLTLLVAGVLSVAAIGCDTDPRWTTGKVVDIRPTHEIDGVQIEFSDGRVMTFRNFRHVTLYKGATVKIQTYSSDNVIESVEKVEQ
jgi:hypothetical protein